MKKIVLIEEFPLVSIVMKELLENIYPSSQVTTVLKPVEISPDQSFTAELVVCDLYGEEPAQLQTLNAVTDKFLHTKKIIFSSSFSESLENQVKKMNGLCVVRSMGYREIMEAISAFDRSNSSELDLHSSRNEFQSEIQMPGAEKPLTIKQVEVMELCIQGYSGKEIARLLDLSPETVRAHLKQCYSRLLAKNRAHAVSNFEIAKRLAKRLASID